MEQATEKQIAFAKKLGIANPEQFSKLALKELIQGKVGDEPQYQQQKPKNTQSGASQGAIGLVINRNEKANSYEFGKAGNRFKLYFEDVDDLKAKINDLVSAGLCDNPTEVYPQDFSSENGDN